MSGCLLISALLWRWIIELEYFFFFKLGENQLSDADIYTTVNIVFEILKAVRVEMKMMKRCRFFASFAKNLAISDKLSKVG